MRYVVLLGRILFAMIFILNFPGHFSQDLINEATSQGLPAAGLLVPLAGILSLVGGLSILLGYKAKHGAWLLVIFLIPTSFLIHKFWNLPDPMMAAIQHDMFVKNIALLGAALMLTHLDSGPLSLDKIFKK